MPSNSYGQEIGAPLDGWQPCTRPTRAPIVGRWCRIEPLAASHADALFTAFQEAPDGRDWTYMGTGRIEDRRAWDTFVSMESVSDDPLHHAILDRATGEALGKAALMRIDTANGVIEIGHVALSPRLQRTRLATEAMYLLAHRAFDELRYRRLEWKCDALNAPSRRAAERLGFTYEGIFRQAVVTKGRNRDTAWFAIVDRDWAPLRAAFEAWLAPENFGGDGRQKRRLASFR